MESLAMASFPIVFGLEVLWKKTYYDAKVGGMHSSSHAAEDLV